ncbi:hypothetical protein N7532_001984, partial [Penicillium argentinense]
IGKFIPRKALEPAILEGVDEEDFVRCCECVYSGDYSAPYPIPGSSEGDKSQPIDVEKQCQKAAKRWDPSYLTWNLFHPVYAAVFLTHTEIHRFAFRTGWYPLRVLSYCRFLRLLEKFTVFKARTGDIVQLLEFVFEDSEYMQNLASMARDYMVWNVEMIMRKADFKSFLQRNSLEQTVFRSMWYSRS